jgi:hypothetical protein
MGYSSFPGPRKAISFDGHELRAFYPFAPTIGDQTNGLIAFSNGKYLAIGFICDKGYIENPDEFFQIFTDNLNIFIYGDKDGLKKAKEAEKTIKDIPAKL